MNENKSVKKYDLSPYFSLSQGVSLESIKRLIDEEGDNNRPEFKILVVL